MALVTFTALAKAGIPQASRCSGRPDQIKVTIDILGFSSSAVAKVTERKQQDQRQGH